MTITNHWGKWVDSETPITGVICNNDIAQYLSDEYSNAIDLDYEAWAKDHDCPDLDNCECEYETDGNQTMLYGDWKKDDDGLYEPNQDGPEGFAAIVGEVYTQIVWSKTIARAALCSPCYPGQADLDSEGDYSAYTLPDDCFYQ